MTPAVLAGFVQFKDMMRVFDGTDPVTPLFENGNQFLDEGGFPGLRTTDDTNNGCHSSIFVIVGPIKIII
jgi:hypothetical protein